MFSDARYSEIICGRERLERKVGVLLLSVSQPPSISSENCRDTSSERTVGDNSNPKLPRSKGLPGAFRRLMIIAWKGLPQGKAPAR